jgi:mannose-6-phosphate isomerase-like protein (cupin superfamily)
MVIVGRRESLKIIDKNTARRYHRDNITSYLLTSEAASGARFITTSLVEMGLGGEQSLHSHETEQCYFILEGNGMMTVGNEAREVTSGMSIFIPSNTPHGLINTGENILRYLSAGSPPFGKRSEIDLWPLPSLNEEHKKCSCQPRS